MAEAVGALPCFRSAPTVMACGKTMRFVSRVSFRRLGCEFAQVCEITVGCVILRSHEITHPGVKSQ